MKAQPQRPKPADPDPLAAVVMVGLAAGRIGIGIGAFAMTRRALGLLGFERPAAESVALARLAGGRDIALGLHALSALGDRDRLREAAMLGALVDGGDAIAFGAALVNRDGIDRTALTNSPLGAAAALAGLWAFDRLR